MGLFSSCFTPLRSSSSSSSSYSIDEKESYRHTPTFPSNPTREDSSSKLAQLRAQLTENKLDAYVVPTADAHSSEYVGESDKRRAWLSSFNGSAGVAIVTHDAAHLFTDSRYWVQASKQLDDNWTLEKVGSDKVKNWDAWLLDLPEQSRVGIDPSVLDYGTGKSLRSKLSQNSISLVFPSDNLVDSIWSSRRPRSASRIELHPLKFSGKPASEKLTDLRTYLTSQHPSPNDEPTSYLLTTLSPIAWLLNLRGKDVDFNPVFFSFVLVNSKAGFTVWVQEAAVTDEIRKEIEETGGKIAKYENVLEDLAKVEGKVVTDSKINMAIVEVLGEDRVEIVKSPVETAQAIKNSTEIQGLRYAYLRDGVAWAHWAAWLEEEVKKRAVTEWEAAEKLTEYREKNENYAGLAYENISATGENAALPHYAPSPSNPIPISLKAPYLNDSGANYKDGTIDTTRTVHFGKPTKEQKRAFTRVLQGHIAIDRVVFPEGTTGAAIDVLARSPLWSEGMNYNHGTGHGVGSYLSVHETQVGISGSSLAYFNTPFVPGHVTSNEPAYYEIGSYGIRIESVLGVKEVDTRRGFGDKRWLGFERFTTVPIQTKMVDYSLLSREEMTWLKQHNETCRRKLAPFVKHDKRAVKWLERQ
ncbi:aminopeptidase P family protein [Sporobolomyces salmoneus]|uniref:aminopeptidase P family protein n=1 Tax=Sporobolomyces salmoneus TaxID=183962 RepID=UPI00316C81E2